MINSLFEKFKTLKNKIKLDAARKELIKGNLVEYMNSLQAEKTLGDARYSTQRELGIMSFLYKPMPIFAVVVIIALAGGGGVSLAARNALPGDALYPVKVSFNEKIEATLRFSQESKANYEVELASRRLEEATELASHRSISGGEKADIESRFQTHADKVESRIQEIETKGNVRTAADIASRFEASLNAHEAILEKLEGRDSNVKEIKKGVRSALGNIKGVRVGLESKVASSSTAEFGGDGHGAKNAAEGKVNAAANVIASVRSYVESKKEKLGATATADAETKLAAADAFVVNARTKIDAGAYGEAFNLGNEAIRTAQEARVLIGANVNLNIDVKIYNKSDDAMDASGSVEREEDENDEEDEKDNSTLGTDDALRSEGRSER